MSLKTWITGEKLSASDLNGNSDVFLAAAGPYAADGGANDTYVVTLSPVPVSYTAGMMVRFKANTVNTGPATLNVNTLGAKTIKKLTPSSGKIDLSDGDIVAGHICIVNYDGTDFILANPSQRMYTTGLLAGLTKNLANNEDSNSDETITIGFQPRLIKLHFLVQGVGDSYTNIKVCNALFTGTTLTFNEMTYTGRGVNDPTTALPQKPYTSPFIGFSQLSTASPIEVGVVGGSFWGTDYKVTLTINSVSANGFVIRARCQVSSGAAYTGAIIYAGWYEVFG